jgi:hypothetical protein
MGAHVKHSDLVEAACAFGMIFQVRDLLLEFGRPCPIIVAVKECQILAAAGLKRGSRICVHADIALVQ